MLGVVCVREWLLVFHFSCSNAWHKPSMVNGAVFIFLSSVKVLHSLLRCRNISKFVPIRLDETRAEIHSRSAEKCLLFSLITHILESSILSSCRTRILNPRRLLRGIDDSLCCACRSKAFCLKRAI